MQTQPLCPSTCFYNLGEGWGGSGPWALFLPHFSLVQRASQTARLPQNRPLPQLGLSPALQSGIPAPRGPAAGSLRGACPAPGASFHPYHAKLPFVFRRFLVPPAARPVQRCALAGLRVDAGGGALGAAWRSRPCPRREQAGSGSLRRAAGTARSGLPQPPAEAWPGGAAPCGRGSSQGPLRRPAGARRCAGPSRRPARPGPVPAAPCAPGPGPDGASPGCAPARESRLRGRA